mgnify:CR=1 FL=1
MSAWNVRASHDSAYCKLFLWHKFLDVCMNVCLVFPSTIRDAETSEKTSSCARSSEDTTRSVGSSAKSSRLLICFVAVCSNHSLTADAVVVLTCFCHLLLSLAYRSPF